MLEFTRREKWFIGLIYGIPIAVLMAALFMAFFHAKDWSARHNRGGEWEHWAFAVMIELPALFGILLMTLWAKIGGGRKPFIPRILFLASAGLSQYVQQAYAGSDASASERFVAGVPSVAAMVFIEIVFWVMGLIDEAKEAAKREAAGPAPVVVPLPPMTLPAQPLAHVPPAVPQDTEPEPAPVSPWATPPGTPLPQAAVPRDGAADVPPGRDSGQGDKPQATSVVPPSMSPSAGGVDMGGQDLPASSVEGDPRPTQSGGHVPQDTDDTDTDRDGDTGQGDTGTAGLDPRDLEAWELSQDGKSKKEIAALQGCSEKTVQRRLSKVREVIQSTTPEGEPSNA